MSYLKFDKTVMINLEESLTREVLRTNRKGAYSCTTIVDCNTRKYHGLLVMPIATLDDENHVMLSSLDETVVQNGAEFNLGLHKYENNNFSPKGHKYIREYGGDNVPRTVYRVGGVILSKEKVFSLFENRMMIKYTLEEAHSDTVLRFKPFLAFRSVRDLTIENNHVDKSYTEIPGGIKTRMYPNYPELFMQFNKRAKFVFNPTWYKGIEYTKEQERGNPYKEDLYVPGYFELPIKKGESIVFSAGVDQTPITKLKKLYDNEIINRTPRSSFYNTLKNSAQQFYFRPNEKGAYLLAGYPWFKVRARDLFLALPGCTLGINDPVRFEKIMATAIPAFEKYFETGEQDRFITELDLPDIPLWAIWAIQKYAEDQGIEETKKRYADFVGKCINFICKDKQNEMRIMENGLLYADNSMRAITWMNSKAGDQQVVPRSGYIVEFNALWYNALCFYKKLMDYATLPDKDLLISKIEHSFTKVFFNKYNYLFDYVTGSGKQDWSVRPNMIFAVSLEFSPLTRMQQRNVLDYVTKELLIPKGIRTLSPNSLGYKPYYNGPESERIWAYHQGPAWSWLLGPYLSAYLKLFKRGGVSFVERSLINIEEEMTQHCIGTLSELFDGNPPFTGRGAISYAPNVGTILFVMRTLEKYYDE